MTGDAKLKVFLRPVSAVVRLRWVGHCTHRGRGSWWCHCQLQKKFTVFFLDFISFDSFLPNEESSSKIKFRDSSYFVSCFRKQYSLLLQRRQPVIETYRFSCTLWSFDFLLAQFRACFRILLRCFWKRRHEHNKHDTSCHSKMEVSVTKHHQLVNKCDSFHPWASASMSSEIPPLDAHTQTVSTFRQQVVLFWWILVTPFLQSFPTKGAFPNSCSLGPPEDLLFDGSYEGKLHWATKKNPGVPYFSWVILVGSWRDPYIDLW